MGERETADTLPASQSEVEEEQTLVEHLTDLRKTVLSSVICVAVMFMAMLIFMHQIIPFLSHEHQLVMLGPLDVIRLYAGIALVLSLGLSAPFMAWQAWTFARPAMTDRESKMALLFLPAIFFSFIAGIAFGFFVIFPTVYYFLIGLGAKNFEMMVTAKEYFHFLIMTTVPMGILFEVPLLLMFLTAIQLVTPEKLRKGRKYALLVLAVVSALITPPDFISQILVLVPLLLLYELGILLSSWTVKWMERSKAEKERTV
ncbi:twin-arginine translocase subunit TatC [Bacillus thermotolerans]|uniref:twin-arginine translocase subunit TatC n=1 Tax=Bacillus thermotolerans TaxID=1221996 RepID=UPI000583CB14|nr:twin-arginine translocase subunit TatC [Bacillus thermotolerans]KKB33412.1 Twin-arginine translocation protein TatC [Bacillus thermotolerans]